MEPQFKDQQLVEVIQAPCKLTDTIVFSYQGTDYIKHLVDRYQDGDIYVLGRPDTWLENGKRRQSNDSRTNWGYLKSSEYDIKGCVINNGIIGT